MSEGIITALITGGLAFAGVLVTKFSGNSKLINEIKQENINAINKTKEENNKIINAFKLEVTRNQAITDTKIEELTYEVRKHNDFANRIPKLEGQIASIQDKIDIFHNK